MALLGVSSGEPGSLIKSYSTVFFALAELSSWCALDNTHTHRFPRVPCVLVKLKYGPGELC